MTATNEEFQPYVSILETSFEAGMLIHSPSSSTKKLHGGSILYANEPAQKLFHATAENDLPSIDDVLSFWWKPKEGGVDAVSWSTVIEYATRKDDPVREWPVCGRLLHGKGQTFPGTLRLVQLDSSDLWLVFLQATEPTKNGAARTNSGDSNCSQSVVEGRAQEIVEAALDPMFQIDATGRILMVNRAALKCFQYDRNELIDNNISIICGGGHSQQHDSYLNKYLETGETKVIGKYRELPARRKDGTEFPIQLAVVELATDENSSSGRLFCGFIHDLTARRRNEDIIFGTIDTSLDPVFHINEKCIIKNANMAALDHLGWTWGELLGQNVSMVVGGGHAEHHDAYIQRYLETGEAKAIGKRRRVKARRRDGSEMPIELQLSEIKINGGAERLFCAILTVLQEEEQHCRF